MQELSALSSILDCKIKRNVSGNRVERNHLGETGFIIGVISETHSVEREAFPLQ